MLYTLPVLQDTCILPWELCILGIPLSLSLRKGNSCHWQKYEQCSGGSKQWLYMLVSPQRQAKYNKYTLEERVKVKVGGYGTENGPAKVARHFCQLLDCKLSWGLRCSGCVLFWLKDWITKFKTPKVLKYSVLSKIVKFNAHRISCFMLIGRVWTSPTPVCPMPSVSSVSNAEFCLYWSLVSSAITATTCAFCSAPFRLHQESMSNILSVTNRGRGKGQPLRLWTKEPSHCAAYALLPHSCSPHNVLHSPS